MRCPVNSVKTSKMNLWMSVVAMALGASVAVASDETGTSRALIGDFSPAVPDLGTIGLPSPPPGGGSFTPPVEVDPGSPVVPEAPEAEPEVPVLTAELVLQEVEVRMDSRYLMVVRAMDIGFRLFSNDFLDSPVSKQALAARSAAYKAGAKSLEGEFKAMQAEAAAQLRALGASKEQFKRLSSMTKEYRIGAKFAGKYYSDLVRAMIDEV